MVQNEIQRRKELGLRNSSAGVFSTKIICADCNSFFGSKVWHSNNKYRRKIWQCRHKFNNKIKCTTPHFKEDELKTLFLKAFNQIISDKQSLLSDCEMILTMFSDTKELDKNINDTQEKFDNILKLIEAHINENATSKLDQKQYKLKHQAYLEQYEKEKSKLENLQNLKIKRKAKSQGIKAFIDQIKENGEVITEFNEELFFATIEKITVSADKSTIITFKNGTELLQILKNKFQKELPEFKKPLEAKVYLSAAMLTFTTFLTALFTTFFSVAMLMAFISATFMPSVSATSVSTTTTTTTTE